MGAKDLVINKFDANYFIISRVREKEFLPIDKEIEEKLNIAFTDIVPWRKDVQQQILRTVRLYGIPLHLWKDEYFRKLGNEIGKVVCVHNDLQSFEYIQFSTLTKNGKMTSKHYNCLLDMRSMKCMLIMNTISMKRDAT